MHFVGILILIAAVPAFYSLLSYPAGRALAYVGLGALPILHLALNFDAALIDWASWQGHTKGLLLTLLDSLALAICLRFSRFHARPILVWSFALYLLSLTPGLFAGRLFEPAFFYLFQGLRMFLVFYASYLVVQRGAIRQIAVGLAVSILVNAAVALYQALSGVAQAPGLFEHQNLGGLATNICVPIFVALGFRPRGGLLLAAAAAGGLSALVGGSRATIVFYGLALGATLVGSLMVKPTPRKIAVASLAALVLLAGSPIAFSKLEHRGGVLAVDLERVAFERAAKMMITDHPWGVGLNQYVVTANTGGYLSRAGVRWGQSARSTNVHNFYLLVRAEGGLIALVGFLIWILAPIVTGLRWFVHKNAPSREVGFAVSIALAVTALHSQYEWILATIVPQYLLGLVMGMLAGVVGVRMRIKRSVPGGAARVAAVTLKSHDLT